MSLIIEVERSVRQSDRPAISEGIQRAFEAKPQKGTWAIRVIGDDGGHSDRYLFYFEQNGRNVGVLEQSVSDLHLSFWRAHMPRKDLVSAVAHLIDFWIDNTDNPIQR